MRPLHQHGAAYVSAVVAANVQPTRVKAPGWWRSATQQGYHGPLDDGQVELAASIWWSRAGLAMVEFVLVTRANINKPKSLASKKSTYSTHNVQMSDLTNFKKADLLSVAKKVGIHVLTKDTKKVLIEKLSAYIQENPQEALEAIKSIEQNDDDDEEEAHTVVESEDDDVEAEVVVAEDDEDADYNAPPPINLKAKIVDPVIDLWEQAISKTYEFTDSVGITVTDYSDSLREQLSQAVTLNFLELLAEVVFFLYTYVPIVAVKDNNSIHQVFKDNIEYLNKSDVPLPDFTALLDWSVVSVFVHWVLAAVVAPLTLAYYFNFSRRVLVFDEEEGVVARIFKYDPFVFALSKVIIFFYFAKSSPWTTLSTESGLVAAVYNFVLIQLGVYSKFVVGLGSFPLVIGFANVVLVLYSQFEDY